MDDEQFRLLADNLPTLCWIANGDGYIVWYNRRWHEYCGSTPAEMEGWGWQSVHDPQLLPDVMSRWQAAIANGDPFEMTFPLKGADGVFRPFLTRIQPVRDASGKVARWYGVNTDVSGQAFVEAELARREAHLAAFFEQSAAGMAETDASGRFVRVNDRYCQITGRTRQELLGLRMQDITHPDDLGLNIPMFQEATQSGKSFEIEKRYVRPDGSIAWVHNSVTTVRDPSGAPQNTVCVSIDITAQREALQRLEQSEALQRAVNEATPECIKIVGADGSLLAMNPAGLQMVEADDFATVSHADTFQLIAPEDRPAWKAFHRRVLAGERTTHQFDIIGLRGTRRSMETHAVPIRLPDGVVAQLAVTRDVTRRKAAEAELRAKENRLRLALDAAKMAAWEVDLVTGEVFSTPELNRLVGLPADAKPTLEELQADYYPGELDRMQDLFQAALAAGERYFEAAYRHVRRNDGAVRWLLLRTSAEFDADGTPLRVVGVVMDITERKEAEERVELLAREVDHRANNLMAVVQSTVALSRAETVSELKSLITGRVHALAHAHQLLSVGRWQGADLHSLAEQELLPFTMGDASRAAICGPRVSLPPALAQAIAMCLHELATNAAKHGALSLKGGQVHVTWSVEPGARLTILWTEQGGPPVSPPSRRGFGSTVLDRTLGGALGGSTQLDWRASGLHCTLTVPLPEDAQAEAPPVTL